MIVLKDGHDVYMETNIRPNQNKNASFNMLIQRFLILSNPFVNKFHFKRERWFMSIIIRNAVHAHTYSAPVFLLGVKLSPLPVCVLHLRQITWQKGNIKYPMNVHILLDTH